MSGGVSRSSNWASRDARFVLKEGHTINASCCSPGCLWWQTKKDPAARRCAPCKQHEESNQMALAIVQNPKSFRLDLCPSIAVKILMSSCRRGSNQCRQHCQCLNTPTINNTANNNDDDGVVRFEVWTVTDVCGAVTSRGRGQLQTKLRPPPRSGTCFSLYIGHPVYKAQRAVELVSATFIKMHLSRHHKKVTIWHWISPHVRIFTFSIINLKSCFSSVHHPSIFLHSATFPSNSCLSGIILTSSAAD